MDIKNFEKYLRLCRKYGVDEFKIGEIEVKLSKDPPKSRYIENKIARHDQPQLPPMSDMDVLLWSSGGIPPDGEMNA